MGKGRRKERNVDPKHKFLRLLDHLTNNDSERALEYRIPYWGSEALAAGSNSIVTPGDEISLGSKSRFWVITEYSVGGQDHLFRQDNKNPKGKPQPPTPDFTFWVNWAEMLNILKKEGTPVIHPDTGEEVYYEPIELPDGSIFEAWEQARRDYEREVLPPKETYYSAVIQAYYNPSPSLKQWEEDLTPEGVNRASHALEEMLGGKPKSKLFDESIAGNDSLKSIFSRLSQEERDYLMKQLGIKPPQEDANPLAKLIKDYMKDNKIKDVETLVEKLIEPLVGSKPRKFSLFRSAVSFVEDQILEGVIPDDEEADGYEILGFLSKVLTKEDGESFKDQDELLAYCFPQKKPHTNNSSNLAQ